MGNLRFSKMKLGLFFFLAAHAKPGTTTGDAGLQCPEAAPISCEDCADMGRDCVRELDAVQACKEFKWDPKKNKCPPSDDNQDEGPKCPKKPKKCLQCERMHEDCFDAKMEKLCEKLGLVEGKCPDDDTKPTGGPKPNCPKDVEECDQCDGIAEQCFRKDKDLKKQCKLLCQDDTKPTKDPKPTDGTKPTKPPVDCPAEVASCDQCDGIAGICFKKDKDLKKQCKLLCQDDDDTKPTKEPKPTGDPTKCPERKPKTCKLCNKFEQCFAEDNKLAEHCAELCANENAQDIDDKPKCPKEPKTCKACDKADRACHAIPKFNEACKALQCADDNESGETDDSNNEDKPKE